MPHDDKWVISSSGHHLFVSFSVGIYNSKPGFTAKIQYGNEIKNLHYASYNYSRQKIVKKFLLTLLLLY